MKWYKIKNVWWPCKLLESLEVGHEVATMEVYDDARTAMNVEVTELKPFEKLARIPRSRTAEWRRAYERAMAEYEN